MSGKEFIDWYNYFKIFPFKEKREDQRHAQLIAILCQLKGIDKQVVDFLPDYLDIRTEEKKNEVASKIDTWAASYNRAYEKKLNKGKK